MFNKAVKDVLGQDASVSVKNSLNKGLYIEINKSLSEKTISELKHKMKKLSEEDCPIVKHHFSKEKAIELAKQLNQNEIIDLLNTLETIDDVQIYSLQGEMVFLYSQTVPSTGYLKYFDLSLYKNGLVLTFPHPADPLEMPAEQKQPKLYDAFKEAGK